MPGVEPNKTPDDAAMRARLEKLLSQLETRREADAGANKAGRGGAGGDSGLGQGLRAASELVTGVLVGGFIGWSLDSWLGTKPWLSILFFLLGITAGFWNVMRGAFAPTGGSRDDKSSGPGA